MVIMFKSISKNRRIHFIFTFGFAILQLFVIAIIVSFFLKDDRMTYSINRDKLITEMQIAANKCGKDFFFSWIVLDLNKSQNKYFFEDVIGCNPILLPRNCAFSVKSALLNPFYNDLSHEIDERTMRWLDKIQTGNIGIYPISYLDNFPSFKKAILSSNKKPKYLGLTLVKSNKDGNLHLFTVSDTSARESGVCDKEKVVSFLERISSLAQKSI